jgi:hypothetical protein
MARPPSPAPMHLPKAAMALLLLGTVLAGCSSDSPSTGPPAGPDPSAYVAPEAVPAVDAAALLADHEAFVTEFNVRKGNDPRHEGARQALTEAFESYGLEVYRHNFTEGGLDQSNIVGIRWGADRQRWVVVGGHYDTTTNGGAATEEQSQGAYDDGSGTMITVHMAKAFSAVQPYYTMAFVGYDGEERGLQGATAFVQDVVVGDESPYGDVEVVGTVDLDMIGINWPGTNAPVIVLSNSEAIYAAADAKRDAMGWPDEQWKRKDSLAEAGLVALGSSDFAAFMAEGIPTIFLISDFIEMGVPSPVPAPAAASTPVGVYPFWHQFDTVDTMRAMAGGPANLEAGFQSVSDVVADVLYRLACQPGQEWDGRVQ